MTSEVVESGTLHGTDATAVQDGAGGRVRVRLQELHHGHASATYSEKRKET